ncbi:MAG: hypothetical protein K6E49_02080 [Lachnospiraceae bacterium]|nr:hypothetical protein [Lachnospiraceae bacterium]
MNNKNHTRAKILIMIPVIVFVLTAACLVPLNISYFSSGSDVTAVAIIFVGTLSLIITTVPCLVISIVGTVYAARAKTEGHKESRKFFVIGIIEIVIYSLGAICAIIAVLFTILAASR